MSAERTRTESKPERFGALARLPLFFALKDKRAVIAGGSPAAAWKAELVSAAGARVDVYAGDACNQLSQLATDSSAGKVVLHRREWAAVDLSGAALAIGDFRADVEAAAFAAAARAAGVPVNVIDKPAFCDFSFGAIVNRSPLVIGISTDGAAPAFARAIRGKIEALLPLGFARWTAAAARWRAALKASGLSFAARRKFWELFASHAVAIADGNPSPRDFDRFFASAVDSGSAPEQGTVTAIGIDPGDPESLTLRAIRALHAADVILFDARVPAAVLDFARREARKIRVGNTDRDGAIEAMTIELKNQGRRVVQLTCSARPSAAELSRPEPRRSAPPLVPHQDTVPAG
jgi:uroporphyrin-III C-methyltransferase/precorrin-2 dehydrogenase/sirohydrochlorin ferrochelatase